MTKQKLIDHLNNRIKNEISCHNPLKYLKNYKSEDFMDYVISVVYLYTRNKKGQNKTIYFSEVIAAIGHNIRNKLKLRRDSALAAKTGAFILYSFEYHGILQVVLGQGTKGHNSYIIQVLNDDAICSLWSHINPTHTEKLPSLTPYEPWTSTKHPSGFFLIKTGNQEVLNSVKPETHPIVYDCVNKAQKVGWQINKDIFNIALWALRNKTEAFNDIWELHNPEARASKLREARTVIDMANRFLNTIFYHLYSLDFRGRKYAATAYLHEQGSDLAKGLLLRAEKKAIGQAGFFWLCVSIASSWAGESGRDDGAKTDKIPLKERAEWTLDNEEIILSYADNPKVNQGWMKADKPWQFIAACFELKKLREWQILKARESLKEDWEMFECYDYESHLECYIDGSTNGSQHLTALTRDEITAPYVNLIPQELPGDLYKYVAEHVWGHLETLIKGMSKNRIQDCERFIDNLIEMKKEINLAEPKSDKRKELVADIQHLKSANHELLEDSSIVYWYRIKDLKQRRKIVKR